MNPGRDLDILVHEHVMGESPPPAIGDHSQTYNVPRYSEDISAAWLVVEKFGTFYAGESSPERHHWTLPYEDEEGAPCWSIGEGESAPHAICLAALKAVGFQL